MVTKSVSSIRGQGRAADVDRNTKKNEGGGASRGRPRKSCRYAEGSVSDRPYGIETVLRKLVAYRKDQIDSGERICKWSDRNELRDFVMDAIPRIQTQADANEMIKYMVNSGFVQTDDAGYCIPRGCLLKIRAFLERINR